MFNNTTNQKTELVGRKKGFNCLHLVLALQAYAATGVLANISLYKGNISKRADSSILLNRHDYILSQRETASVCQLDYTCITKTGLLIPGLAISLADPVTYT